MKFFVPNEKKENLIYKKYIKNKIKDASFFSKLCYFLDKFLKISSIILGLATVFYVVLLSHDPLDLIFVILTFVFPFAFSFIPMTVYYTSVLKNYRFRQNQNIGVSNDLIQYSYDELMISVNYEYKISIDQLDRVEYYQSTGEIKFIGRILYTLCDVSEDGEKVQVKEQKIVNDFMILDLFDGDIVNILKSLNVQVEEK